MVPEQFEEMLTLPESVIGCAVLLLVLPVSAAVTFPWPSKLATPPALERP
jgi:hypothetical protein